ncbi:hypothetical protein BJ165DRAFT_1426883 [Panaeolus papilionaceus]|nr:hypothetical protein BJ165DRAFT_1426883 [Panaeolus papilionaceus]
MEGGEEQMAGSRNSRTHGQNATGNKIWINQNLLLHLQPPAEPVGLFVGECEACLLLLLALLPYSLISSFLLYLRLSLAPPLYILILILHHSSCTSATSL